jgi:hypothetical protein
MVYLTYKKYIIAYNFLIENYLNKTYGYHIFLPKFKK